MPTAPPDLGPRYRALKRLGRGGQGSVWAAADRHAPGREVAVKLLPRAEGAQPLSAEYAMLARLRHPALPRVHQLLLQPQPMLVAELIQGQPLDEWWSGQPPGQVLGALAQLLGALDFIHRRGVIHRDVKPDNVLVGPDGVRLVDLGLASASGSATAPGGTVGYIAPEVLGGRAATPQSDLYAVGVLLFRATWGRLPFAGDAQQMLAQQLSADAVVPDHGAGPGLRQLVQQLLARNPEQRPASAAQVLALLEELEPDSVRSADRALLGLGLPEPCLVGRDAVMVRVERALQRLQQQQPGPDALLLLGPHGSGRSRLCEEAIWRAELCGLQVQRGLRLLHGQPGASLTAAAELEPAALGASAVGAVTAQLRRRLAQGPLVLVLDDLEQDGEAALLTALLDQCHDEGLALLLLASDCRESETLAAQLEPQPLAPLDALQTDQLVRSMLPARWTSDALARQVHRLSGGNPLLAVQLTRAAVGRQLAQGRPANDLARALEGLEAEGHDAGYAALRLTELNQGQRELMALTALMERGLPLPALEQGERALVQQLLPSGLLDLRQGNRLVLAAGSLGPALMRQLPLERRRALHARALELLAAEGQAPGATERALLSWRCGLADEQATVLLDGARQASAQLSLPTAIRLLDAALERGALPCETRVPAALQLAQLLQATGQFQRAVVLMEATLDDCSDERLTLALAEAHLRDGAAEQGLRLLDAAGPEPSAALQLARARLLLFTGQPRQALELTGRLPAAMGTGTADAERSAIEGLGHYYLGQLDRAQTALERGLEQCEGDETERLLLRAKLLNSIALVQQSRGALDQARQCYERCSELARRLGHLPFWSTFEMNAASVAHQQGELARALQLYSSSLEVARRFGGARETAQVAHNLARLLLQLGQEARAAAQVERSLALCHRLGWRALEASNLLLRAEVALQRQEPPERVETDLQRAEQLFAELGDMPHGVEVLLARGRAALPDDAESALRLGEQALSQTRELPTQQVQAALLVGLAALPRHAARAVAVLREGLRLAEELGLRQELVELHEALSRALHAAGDLPQSALHRDTARQLVQAQRAALPRDLQHAFGQVPPRAALLQPAGQGPGAQLPDSAAHAEAHELLQLLRRIGRDLAAEDDLTRLLERIVDHAVELSGAERGFLLLRSRRREDAGPLHIEVARNIDQETIRRRAFKISRSVAEEVLSTGHPINTVNAMHDERFREFLSVHNLRLRSILCVPITIRRQLRGAIYVDNRFREQAFAPHHAELLETLAEQAALAVGYRERLEALEQREAALRSSQRELERANQQLARAMEQQQSELDELAQLARAQKGELEQRYRFDNLVGQSNAMRELFHLMDRVRETDAPVLIHGESGTGKELVAKALHYNGPRREGPFVGINCGAIPATLLEGELFGHEKGAFTGASSRHRGLLERAHLGTLFLDELGDMPQPLQVKLLRVLQERTFVPLGSEEEQQADFRLLAASNKDLGAMVQAGTFREDLYYRINVIKLTLPPLRERREDIPVLVQHLLRRHGGEGRTVAPAALRLLSQYNWPGNVRQLENEILRALALGDEVIGPADLSPAVLQQRGDASGGAAAVPVLETTGRQSLRQAVGELERSLARDALRRSGGNVTEAAKQLGLSRVGLHKLLRRHNLRRGE